MYLSALCNTQTVITCRWFPEGCVWVSCAGFCRSGLRTQSGGKCDTHQCSAERKGIVSDLSAPLERVVIKEPLSRKKAQNGHPERPSAVQTASPSHLHHLGPLGSTVLFNSAWTPAVISLSPPLPKNLSASCFSNFKVQNQKQYRFYLDRLLSTPELSVHPHQTRRRTDFIKQTIESTQSYNDFINMFCSFSQWK
ncbi:hypothetical protein SRHO_G00165530 [Serrasalmus rhombeus]